MTPVQQLNPILYCCYKIENIQNSLFVANWNILWDIASTAIIWKLYFYDDTSEKMLIWLFLYIVMYAPVVKVSHFRVGSIYEGEVDLGNPFRGEF